jgi:acetolactate synthase-1/2/3 large subunit
MNGAQAIIQTLADSGVRACFANPGTSEMHLVGALDHEPRIRSVLCLFEGVATGAADGYGRFSDRPAITLLHLGPGYFNGGANLHNARRAHTAILNLVGDHATYHRQFDAPLGSDIEALAAENSIWMRTAVTAGDAPRLASEAVAASLGPRRGQATLILPADTAWDEAPGCAAPTLVEVAPATDAHLLSTVATRLRQAKVPAIFIGGDALLAPGLAAAARLAGLGVRILTDTLPARLRRGAGVFAPDRTPYFPEAAAADLAAIDLAVLAGTRAPMAFFAYPGTPSECLSADAARLTLTAPGYPTAATLTALADLMDAPEPSPRSEGPRPAAPTGALSSMTVAASMARLLPADAIVVDDGVTGSGPALPLTQDAAPHDWVFNTGGAIGLGMPVALGAAIACPDRRVICLSGDGAGMYTCQALWTMARERTPVVIAIFANRAYNILNYELARTGVTSPGEVAKRMLSLDEPTIDWVALSQSMGVAAYRTGDAAEFERLFADAVKADGPVLIEAVI